MPQKLFANQYDDPVDCERCKQTLTPISQALSLPIVFDYGYPPWLGGNAKAAAAIRNASASSATTLVAWEHVNIQYLPADLGVPKEQIPTWPDSDFDTVYVLRFAQGQLTNFTVAAQNFSPPTAAGLVEGRVSE